MAKSKLGGRKPAEVKREPKRPAPKKWDPNKKPSASEMIREGSDRGRFM